MTGFTHLHVHSEYSLLDGACRLEKLILAAKAQGQTALAITDHGVMYGVIDFYKLAKKHGIKPILGCEVYVAPRKNTDKSEGDGANYHLVLLAKNRAGYQNLLKIVSNAFVEGFYSRPRTDKEFLRAHSEGLCALSACLGGEIASKINDNHYEEAKAAALEYREIFGEDYYLELQNHGIREQLAVNAALRRMSKETGIPLVATNDVHYIAKEDAYAQKVLLCVQTAKTIDEENGMAFETEEFYLKTASEMEAQFPEDEDALANTGKIADVCNVELEFGKLHLPKFDVPEGVSPEEYLRTLCEAGLKTRYGEKPDKLYRERLSYELSVIVQMGYIDYFLIVWDFIKYAKDNDIPVGPGRGSSAGSIVSFCLRITDVDPILYNLPFERFLNPERVSMPDIDIDFCTERREEVIDYVVRRYGQSRVAQIVTFGTMAAKGAVRDVGRVLNLPYAEVDAVAKLIPNEIHITLDDALQKSKELRIQYDESDMVRHLIDTAKKLEGMPRHSSIHAAGIVITARDADEYIPLQKSDKLNVTQYTMGTLEELGLLKMDFLALRNLTVIKAAENIINRNRPPEEHFVTAEAPLGDPGVYALISQGKTEGVFQMESSGMKQVLIGVKPKNIEDILAVISLYRPGPMASIPRYIECRNNPSLIRYKTDLLKDILDVTFGCMIYQEQVMQMVRKIAGYSYARADLVRRAMAKKKADVMAKERQSFIYGKKNEDGSTECVGAIANGVGEQVATELFDEMTAFSSYAFPRGHAAAYAIVAYRTAYLKVHYPKEYMAALISSVIGFTDKMVEYIGECIKMGIAVLPPHVNESGVDFTVSETGIRFGLVAIKNIGFALMEELVREREENGPYRSYCDFLERMSDKGMNKKAAEMLISAGALDGLGANRRQMLMTFENFMDDIVENRRKNIAGQTDLFASDAGLGDFSPELPKAPEMPGKEMLSLEKISTGMYLSGHPMADYRETVDKLKPAAIHEILASFGTESEPLYDDGQTVLIAGIAVSIRRKATKSNTMMGFLILEDMTSQIEIIVFPKTLERVGRILEGDRAYAVRGRITVKEDEEAKLIAEEIVSLDSEEVLRLAPDAEPAKRRKEKKAIRGLFIKVESLQCEAYRRALCLAKFFDGDMPLYVYDASSGKYGSPGSGYAVDGCALLQKELKELLGENAVVLKEKA